MQDSKLMWVAVLVGALGCGGGNDDPARDAAPVTDALNLDAGAEDAVAPDVLGGFDGRPVTDASAPDGPFDEVRALYVTVNDIPFDMLGSLPGTFDGAERNFRWVVPPTGWTVDVHVVHPGGWTPPAEAPYLLLRSVTVEAEPKVLDMSNVDVRGWQRSAHGHTWTAVVRDDISAGSGRYSIQTAVDGDRGEAVTFEVRERPDNTLPFEQTDHWLLTTSRDNSTLSVRAEGTDFVVESANEPNGTPDLEDALAAMGLLGANAEWNTGLLARVHDEIRTRLVEFYPDVNIEFHLEGDALPPEDERLDWSKLAIGGADPRFAAGGRAFFGRAQVDWNNQDANDNTAADLGIFTVNFVRFIFGNALTKAIAADFAPAAGGQAFGDRAGDLRFLEPGFDVNNLPEDERTRASRFVVAVDYLMLAMASVIAHEIGHSVGLVKPGFPPEGLLAEVDGPWVVAPIDGAHIDTAGFNLMQSGTNFALADAIRGQPRFNAPNLAYMRGQIIVLP